MQIKLEHLTKRFGDTVAVNDLSITLESGKLIALLGPSGCGKTTTLNMISGILPVSGGSIFFDDRDVTSLPPEKRGIGLVFQNYALYPHMTVLQNICFPMEIQRIPKKERIRRAEELAEMVHITPYLKRKPAELSGGQQQRVAIARALSKRPDVLLLDEPLSNLDAKLRVEMREEIRRIQREAGITTVFVTHDQEEASSIADRVVLLRDGVLQQEDTARGLYENPVNLFAADFLGTPPINQLHGVVQNGTLCWTAASPLRWRCRTVLQRGRRSFWPSAPKASCRRVIRPPSARLCWSAIPSARTSSSACRPAPPSFAVLFRPSWRFCPAQSWPSA